MLPAVRVRARALTFLVLCLLWPSLAAAQLVTSTGPGVNAVVRVIDTNGTDRSFQPYPAGFGGGTTVALGDVNGDGVLDIVTGAGPGGGPHVRVWDGVTLLEIGGFFAYYPFFGGGVSVAAGDVDGDGRADIITGAGPGGWPHVRVWSGADFHEIGGFLAYHVAFSGGVSVATGDVDGDGRADIITGAGPGGGPHVRVWSGADFHEIGGFFAYDPAFPGGVHVAAGDVNGDGLADIITGAGPGGSPQVRVWNGATFTEIGNFFGYDPAFTGGVTVGAIDLTYDGRVEIITAPGRGAGPLVAIWSPDFSLLGAYFAFDPSFTGGVSIGSPGSSNALRFTSAGATGFHVLTPSTFTVTTAGGGAVPTLTVSGALPTGVTFSDNGDRTATLAGTPAAGTGGSYPLTFTATGSSATPVTQTFTLTITQSPAITSAAATTFGLGGPGTFTVTTTGFPAPTISSTGALPAGVTFTDNGNGTATLAGTPAPGSGGSYPLTITAANGNTPDATQSFVLTVNSSPAFTSANATSFTVGALGTFAITTVATPGVTSITRTGAALPTGVTYVDNGNGTATLTGTPAAGTGGIYTFTLTASNGVGTNAVQTFTLTVREAPVFTSAAATTFVVGAAGTFTVTTTGEPDVTTITQGGAALPAGVTFLNNGDGTATLAGTPGAGTGGIYALTFTINNGVGGNVVQNFTLTVNQAPAFTSATATTFTVGSAGTFTVTTSGVPAITSIARTGDALPAGVNYVDNGNGTATLSGTPAVSTGGVYAFTFTINNGVGGNITQSFTLTVTEAPVFTSAAATTFVVGSFGTFTVTTTGEPDVTTITLGGVALPAGVNFVSNGNGTATLSGTPGAGTGGTYALTFTANNGIGGNVVQNFTLTVNQAPAFTSADTTTFTVGSAGSFTVTTSGVPTVTTITRSAVALPGGVTFVDNLDGTGTLSGMPIAGSSGSYVFTFTATNGVAPDAVQTFTLNVNEPPLFTSANTDTFIVGTADSFTVTTTGFPTPTVTHTLGALPAGVTFTTGTNLLAGTATQIGSFPLQLTAANGVGANAVQTFTLNVVCPAITVSALSLPDGLYQIAYGAVDFNQAGSTGSILTWSATGLPAGIVIDSATGVVSGTPTNTQLATAVAITVTDNFGCTGVHNTALTVRPTTDNESYSGGVGNTQYVVSGAVPTTPHVFVVDNVKNGDNGPGALSVVFGPAANGVVSEGPTDGTFTYTPNVTFAGPTDTFNYTLTDGNGVTNTATVTINLSGLVWYVNGSGANGDGRSHLPFNTVTNAQTPSGDGQVIYVHQGGGTTPGTIVLKPTQTLWGAGETFALNNLTIPFTGFPTLAGTVTLANGVLLNSLNVNGSGSAAITGTNIAGNVAINSVTVVGGSSGISVTNLTGNLTFQFSAVSGITPGAGLLLSGGTGSASGRLDITSTTGRSVDIQGKTAGAVTLAGAIVNTGAGIFLNNNTGASITFTGGMALTTGANPAFTATGGGTVNATQNNTTIVNTLATTSGTALNVANTTIGAAGLTFRSISANGGANGIVLIGTGSNGLTVTGDGTNTSLGGNGSGGTIANMSGADGATVGNGIYLDNVSNIVLRRMTITGTNQNFGIRGFRVNNFILEYATVNGTNGTSGAFDNYGEGSIMFGDDASIATNGLTGSATVTSSVISGGRARNFSVVNTAGTLNRLTISGTMFGLNQNFVDANQSLAVEARNGGTVANVTVTGSTFIGSPGDLSNFTGQTGTTMDVIFASNVGSNVHPQNIIGGGGLTFATQGVMTFAASNNTLRDANGSAITLQKASAGTLLSGTLDNNAIGVAAVPGSGSLTGNGVFLSFAGTGAVRLAMTNNQIRSYSGNAAIFADNTGGTYSADLTITGNTVSNPGAGAFAGLALAAGSPSSSDAIAVCASIVGNNFSAGDPANANDVILGVSTGGSSIRLPGYAGTTLADVQNFVLANNNIAGTVVSAYVDAPATPARFMGGAGCSVP